MTSSSGVPDAGRVPPAEADGGRVGVRRRGACLGDRRWDWGAVGGEPLS